MAAINPYLTFDGNCEEAFNYYRTVFGGEFMGGQLMRFAFMGDHCPAGQEDKVMHVALPIAGGGILMGSDSMPGMPLNVGNNFGVAISSDSVAESDQLFAGLSEGGQVTMPMGNAPWGAYFGMCTDKYGVHWMINHELKQEA